MPTPEYLRIRAAEFRHAAAQCDDASVARILRDLAGAYEDLAEQDALEALASEQPAQSDPAEPESGHSSLPG